MDAIQSSRDSERRSIPSSVNPSLKYDSNEMFRPPVNRAMRVLDRSFFKSTVPLASATVLDAKKINFLRTKLTESKDMLHEQRIRPILPVQDIRKESEELDRKRKCILLRDDIRPNDESTWPPTIHELVKEKSVDVRPYMLHLDYDYWTYADIISSVLPEEELNEAPVGYAQVGHVVHLNLRDHYLPYRHLIGEILLDKVANAKTVINKVDDVGSESEFRTFAYEVLAGDPNMDVVVHEQECEFSFNYAKVYWNSRLNTEHTRLVNRFKEGEVVCDVMAGVGPFAIPAGKKRIFVWANDLNPHGYESMQNIIKKNKVDDFVMPFNMNGSAFIRFAAKALAESDQRVVTLREKVSSTKTIAQGTQGKGGDSKARRKPSVVERSITAPRTFDHFVMNLPASAIDFLDSFIGVYAGYESLFKQRKLPLIHVYCFSADTEDGVFERKDICERISEKIGFTITPQDKDNELEIWDVRLVSPSKRMFCATFRLPAEVAFRRVEKSS